MLKGSIYEFWPLVCGGVLYTSKVIFLYKNLAEGIFSLGKNFSISGLFYWRKSWLIEISMLLRNIPSKRVFASKDFFYVTLYKMSWQKPNSQIEGTFYMFVFPNELDKASVFLCRKIRPGKLSRKWTKYKIKLLILIIVYLRTCRFLP